MSPSEYRARQVSAKTNEVVNYHHDDNLPGKPLHILIPGGLVALASLGIIILIAYRTWFDIQLDQSTGLVLIGVLFPFYVGGVFLFSYGYELYNIPRAIRLTAIIVFLTVAAVVIVAVLALVLGAGGKGSSGNSSKSSKSSGGGGKPSARNTSTSSSGGSHLSGLGNVVVLGGSGGTRTNTVTREVVKEVEVPVVPKPINCPSCGRAYVPVDEKYICPGCGATTPEDLINASQEPKPKDG